MTLGIKPIVMYQSILIPEHFVQCFTAVRSLRSAVPVRRPEVQLRAFVPREPFHPSQPSRLSAWPAGNAGRFVMGAGALLGLGFGKGYASVAPIAIGQRTASELAALEAAECGLRQEFVDPKLFPILE